MTRKTKVLIVTFLLGSVWLLMGAAGNITKNADTAAILEATDGYSGDTADLALDAAYDMNNVGINVTDSFGLHVTLEHDSSGTTDNIILGVFTSLDGSAWDDNPIYEIEFDATAGTDTQETIGLDVSNYAYVSIGVKTSSTNNTFDYRITYREMTANYGG